MGMMKVAISAVTLGVFIVSLLCLVLGGLTAGTVVTFILGLLGIILDARAEIGTLKGVE